MASSTDADSRAAATVALGRRRAATAEIAEEPCVPLLPGAQVSSYVLDHKLAEGGMGVVFAAHHRFLDRAAALKVVHPLLDGLGRARERLLLEAQLLARLDDPGAVQVHDFGYLDDGRPWMAMELLEGTTLGARIEREPLDPVVAVEVLRSIARTLSAAHRLGVIHRDLKPENVFVSSDARIVKVLDWGIAFIRQLPRGARFTELGLALGTPEYLAPEQARGFEVDGRADVYSLGVVAYELFARQVPFRGDNAVDITAQHLQDPPPPMRLVCPEIPRRLEALIMRMLAKDREARPYVDEVIDELSTVLRELGRSG